MLLAIDVGNTNISLGIFKKRRLWEKHSIPTGKALNCSILQAIFKRYSIDDVVICSVVPEQTKDLERILKRLLPKKALIIGRDVIVPMKNLYLRPRQVGQDRLVNAYAGVKFYGSPLVLVDFGTAVTFDVISGAKEYLGGMILPGLQISLDALRERTALLPPVKLKAPEELIGRSTQSSMLSGIVYGFAALVDNLAKNIKHKIGKDALVIGTGGDIRLIGKYCREFDIIDPDLTLKGLNLLIRKKEEG